jgi:hypothetical protein
MSLQCGFYTQPNMVELFQASNQNSRLHIKNSFEEDVLNENAVIKEYLDKCVLLN